MTDAVHRLSAALADRYAIERELGAGGMATVYLAHDVRHDRKVALKVLRPELSAILGGERFLAEIKTTANLQHPHILSLFDSGEADGLVFYVMPYVEGESLRDRLTREKQLPVEDAVRIAREVADALEYAHRHGVVHRDIKPENILLHGGHAMVADFGIALAASRSDGGTRMTETGMSLGTPHYMSPEQAMGEREITPKADIYALGCVLYEMLAGEPPFNGPTAQAIIARVMTEQPRSLTLQRHTIPPGIEAVVHKALEKLPADRFASAADLANALEHPGSLATEGLAATRQSPTVGRPAPWRARLRDPYVLAPSLVAVAALALAVTTARRAPAPPLPPIRYILTATDSTRPIETFPWPAALSPDGGTIVYTGPRGSSGTMLYARRSDQLEGRPIPGTEGGYQPYFAPDGSWLAFESSGKERKVRLDGSAPVTVTSAHGANGADWTTTGEIVLGAQGPFHGLSRVSAAGGEAVALTHPDTNSGARDHLWPIAAPDGRTIVFVIWSGSLASSQLAMTSLDDGRVTPLDLPGIRPLAILDGMIVYIQADGAIMAVGLDAGGRRVSSRPIPVHDPVAVGLQNNGNTAAFVSHGGALVTARGNARGRLVWVRRDGGLEPVLPDARPYAFPRLSPDERRVAVLVADDQQSDVWALDRSQSTFSRLTSTGTARTVTWTADGSHLVYTAGGEEARSAVWSQPALGVSPAEKLFETPLLTPGALVAPDGRSLLVNSLQGNAWAVLRVPLDSAREARTYLGGAGQFSATAFSPDGRWVALLSDESGRFEVYVRSFPDPSARVQISTDGGGEPVWSRDGRRIYYRSGASLLAARVSLSPTFALLGRDTVMATFPGTSTGGFAPNYDVSRDGSRIVAIQSEANDFQLVVSPNWITEFRRRVAESRGK